MNLMDVLEAKRMELADIQLKEESLKEDIQALERVIGMSPDSGGILTNSDINQRETISPVETYSDRLSGISFSKFIEQFCFENGLSRSELASLIGVSPTAVNNWVGGKGITNKHKLSVAQKLQELSGNEYRAQEIVALT